MNNEPQVQSWRVEADNERHETALFRRGIYLIIGGFVGYYLFNKINQHVDLTQLGTSAVIIAKVTIISMVALVFSVLSWLIQRLIYLGIILGACGLTLWFIFVAYMNTRQ